MYFAEVLYLWVFHAIRAIFYKSLNNKRPLCPYTNRLKFWGWYKYPQRARKRDSGKIGVFCLEKVHK